MLIFIPLSFLGVLFFMNGFFLTKYSINQFNNQSYDAFCVAKNIETCGISDRRFDKVVIIVIDSLRLDFMVEVGSNSSGSFNRLSFLQKSLKNKPEYTNLYSLYADPPTVTSQRIQGITSGTLPTFIDIGVNMNSKQYLDDNIIRQLHVNEKKYGLYFIIQAMLFLTTSS